MDEFVQAVSSGDLEKVRAMLAADAALASARASSGETVVQRAVYYGKRDVVGALLEAKPELDMGTACAVGDLDAVRCLASNDAEAIDRLSGDGFLPLCLAAGFGHLDVLTFLLEAGGNPNARSLALGGVAPLDSAIFGRNAAIVRALIGKGANVNSPQQGGFRPLHGAAQNGDTEIVDLLLSNGADRSALTDTGQSARDLATKAGHEHLARRL